MEKREGESLDELPREIVESISTHLDLPSRSFLAVTCKTLNRFQELEIPRLRKLLKDLVRNGYTSGLDLFKNEITSSPKLTSFFFSIVQKFGQGPILDWVENNLPTLSLDNIFADFRQYHLFTPAAYDFYEKYSTKIGVIFSEIRDPKDVAEDALEIDNIPLYMHLAFKFNLRITQSSMQIFEKLNVEQLSALNSNNGIYDCLCEPGVADRAAKNSLNVLKYVLENEGRISPEAYGHAITVLSRENFEYLRSNPIREIIYSNNAALQSISYSNGVDVALSVEDIEFFRGLNLFHFFPEHFLKAMRQGKLWVAQWAKKAGELETFSKDLRSQVFAKAIRSGNPNLIRFFETLNWNDLENLFRYSSLAKKPGFYEAVPYLSKSTLESFFSNKVYPLGALEAALIEGHRKLFAWVVLNRPETLTLNLIREVIDSIVGSERGHWPQSFLDRLLNK